MVDHSFVEESIVEEVDNYAVEAYYYHTDNNYHHHLVSLHIVEVLGE